MKIRHPLLIKAAGFLIAWVIRLWISSLRYLYRPVEEDVTPHAPGLKERFLYVFWHENMLVPAYHYGRPDTWVLISQHADGQMIAQACRHLRMRVVTGSTTRGGVEALRQMLRIGKKAHLVITPDGPRGPRRRVQPGLIYLAARTGLPIIPVGLGYQKASRLPSWDRMALPWPGSAVVVITAARLLVPPDLSRAELEAQRLRVEQAMEQVTAEAERLAAREGW
jgi:lysophospholipid acyltransferase (LPLAT)-like uncharacterized protein